MSAVSALFLLVAGLVAQQQPPQDPADAPQTPGEPPRLVFSEEVAVQWVTVPVTLLGTAPDEDGRPNDRADADLASGVELASEDFVLRVDGRPVAVESFDSGAAPFGLLFAQDLSGSMAHGEKLGLSRTALDLLLSRAGELDEVAILTFGGPTIALQVAFTSDFRQLDQASARWRPYGTTALYDALTHVAEVARESHRSRRAVVLVSDGIDNASVVEAEQARSLLQGAGLPVFVLDVAARFERLAERAGGTNRPAASPVAALEEDAIAFSLAELANATGGRYLDVVDFAAMQRAAEQVMRDLREQYVLGFTTDATSPPSWHRIEVALLAEKGKPARALRHRTRYYGSPPAAWTADADAVTEGAAPHAAQVAARSAPRARDAGVVPR